MNGSAATWAFAQHVQPVSTKFVLVTLACFATRESWQASLSVLDVAKHTGLKRSAIFEALAQLKKLGLIQATGVLTGPSNQLPIYSVNPSRCWTPTRPDSGPVQMLDSTRPDNGPPLPSPPPPITSASSSLFPVQPDTPPLPPQGGNGQLDLPEVKNTRKQKEEWLAAFEEFWAAILPANRKGKKRACELFLKALKNGTTIQEIFDGIPSFRKDERKRSHQNDYRPLHADTWMFQERWKDSVVIQQPVEQEPSDEGWIEKSIYG